MGTFGAHAVLLSAVHMPHEPAAAVSHPTFHARGASGDLHVDCAPLPLPIWKLLRPAAQIGPHTGLGTFLHKVITAMSCQAVLNSCSRVYSVIRQQDAARMVSTPHMMLSYACRMRCD
jgi:hypothetical protein